MHQRKSKTILIYFFLLLLVGSINNIGLNNFRFKEIKDINIIGLDDYENLRLLKKIKSIDIGNIFFVNRKEISNQINENSLVEKYEIFKKYPSSLEVNIDKTKFLARINKNGKIFLLGSNGKLSNNSFSNQLPFIFGKPDIDEFLNFREVINHSKFSYDQIKNLYFFPSKRWDLELNNNIIIKLPKSYPEKALEFAFEFIHNQDLKNIKIVDARIKKQIILND